MQSFSHASHRCGHDSFSPIVIYTVTGGPQYCDHLGPTPWGSVRWYAQRAASMCMCMSPYARGGWWCTVPVSLCVVTKCYASWFIICTSFASYTVWRGDWRKRTTTCGLHSNAEFQPCEPLMWPRFFVFNRCIYGQSVAFWSIHHGQPSFFNSHWWGTRPLIGG